MEGHGTLAEIARGNVLKKAAVRLRKEGLAMTDQLRPSSHEYSAFMETLALRFADDPTVERGTMFRSPGLRVGGKIFVFLGHDDQLIVKIPRHRAEACVAAGEAEPVSIGKRTMKEWVAVPALGSGTMEPGQQLSGIIDEAYTYVRGLESE